MGIPADAERLSWGDLEAMSVDLAEKVEADPREFSRLLVLQRGGAFVGNILAYRLRFLGHQVLSAGISSYIPGSSERSDEFVIGQFPRREEVEGQSVLVVDEVCDSGHTLVRAHGELRWLGAEAVASAVLHYKPERTETGYVPDFYSRITNSWLVYPWERYEAELEPAEAA